MSSDDEGFSELQTIRTSSSDLVEHLVLENFESLLIKTIDVAYVICYYNFKKCGTLEELIADILPTTIVLNCTIWPFLRREDGSNLCICDQYNVKCNHIRKLAPDDFHCINIERLRQLSLRNASNPLIMGNHVPWKYKLDLIESPKTLGYGYLMSLSIRTKGPYILGPTGRIIRATINVGAFHLRFVCLTGKNENNEKYEINMSEDFKSLFSFLLYHDDKVDPSFLAKNFWNTNTFDCKYNRTLFPSTLVLSSNDSNQPNQGPNLDKDKITVVVTTGMVFPRRETSEFYWEKIRKAKLRIMKDLQDEICNYLRGDHVPRSTLSD